MMPVTWRPTILCCIYHEVQGHSAYGSASRETTRKRRTCTIHSMRSIPHGLNIASMDPHPNQNLWLQAAAGGADQLPSTAAGTALAVKAVLKATYPAAVFATAANYADQVRKRRCHSCRVALSQLPRRAFRLLMPVARQRVAGQHLHTRLPRADYVVQQSIKMSLLLPAGWHGRSLCCAHTYRAVHWLPACAVAGAAASGRALRAGLPRNGAGAGVAGGHRGRHWADALAGGVHQANRAGLPDRLCHGRAHSAPFQQRH